MAVRIDHAGHLRHFLSGGHAAVSTWLNAGVPAPQLAARAGHSVRVLLEVYAKCIDGEQEAARQRIESVPGIKPAEQPDRDGIG
jgi:hypothetical protein